MKTIQRILDQHSALALPGLFGAAAAMHPLYTKRMTDGTSTGAEDPLMGFASSDELIGVEERLALARRLQEVAE